ncbi:MAG TPA: glutathione peroxidase [Acidobacteriaceae bacterium]
MKKSWHVLACLLLSAHFAVAGAVEATKHKSIYDYSLVALDGKVVSLSAYKGKALLIVNLASKSIYSDQIAALNDIEKAYADKGLVVLGIPSSDFGSEELTDSAAVEKYYHETAKAGFTVFSKACLRGNDEIPLAHFLTDPKEGTPGGEIHWNFTKFVVNREGKPILRYESDADPADPDFRVTLEKVLDGSFKKGGGDKGGPPAAGGDDDDDDGGI